MKGCGMRAGRIVRGFGRLLAQGASAVAWLFIVGSVFAVLSAMWPFLPQAGDKWVFHTKAYGVDHYSYGLVYRGVGGLLLGFAEVVAVVVASALSRSRVEILRRVSLLGLLAWNGLFLADAAVMYRADRLHMWLYVGAGLGFLGLCTLARTIRCWNRGAGAADLRH